MEFSQAQTRSNKGSLITYRLNQYYVLRFIERVAYFPLSHPIVQTETNSAITFAAPLFLTHKPSSRTQHKFRTTLHQL